MKTTGIGILGGILFTIIVALAIILKLLVTASFIVALVWLVWQGLKMVGILG